jgi:hypothetical protein
VPVSGTLIEAAQLAMRQVISILSFIMQCQAKSVIEVLMNFCESLVPDGEQ